MLLILEEYFRDHPIKKRIVEGLYERGISVGNGKFYSNGIELSVSEVAKSFRVNRRTVYDTIKIIENTPGVREIMSRLKPGPDLCNVATLMGDQVVTLQICPGYFSKAMGALMDAVRKYGCYMKEIFGRNISSDQILLRAIFHRTVPRRVFEELSEVEGVEKIIIETPGNGENEVVCPKCDVRVCPNKLSSSFYEEKLAEL